ncbi:MAG: hypothetical protein ACR2PU_03745 [Gammaproteobacteria bacterium]
MKYLDKILNDNESVRFMFFLSGKLWYRTESGFKFPVPIKGTRQSVFLNEDRAKRFYPYIKAHAEKLDKAKAA